MGVMAHPSVQYCRHCGSEFVGAKNTKAHEATCLHVPANEAKLRTVPVDIAINKYGKESAANGWPSRSFLVKQFGTWHAFKQWLASDLPFSAIRPRMKPRIPTFNTIDEEIEQEAAEARAALNSRGEGLTVFDTPRRTWEAGGRTWQSWGIR